MLKIFDHQYSRFAISVIVLSLMLVGNAVSKSNQVKLSKDSVIEIVFVDVKHGKKDLFFKDYFSKIEPIIKSYGGSMKAKFETFNVEEGEITPQYVLLMEWPSASSFNRAIKDDRMVPYLQFKKQSLRAIHSGLYTIEKDISFTLQEGVVYEFFAGNPASAKTPQLLGQFFQKVIPTALEYGRGDLLALQPVQTQGANYNRMIAGVATWPSAAHFYQFTNTSVFRDGVRDLRDPAFAQLELINTHYISE